MHRADLSVNTHTHTPRRVLGVKYMHTLKTPTRKIGKLVHDFVRSREKLMHARHGSGDRLLDIPLDDLQMGSVVNVCMYRVFKYVQG